MSKIQKSGVKEPVEEPIADDNALVSVCDRDICAGRPLVRIWERK
jgi:hypothetical protein